MTRPFFDRKSLSVENLSRGYLNVVPHHEILINFVLQFFAQDFDYFLNYIITNSVQYKKEWQSFKINKTNEVSNLEM